MVSVTCQRDLKHICTIRGSLHESGLSYNPDRTRFISVEITRD